MVKNIKEVHPEFSLLFKIGSFYHAYVGDLYIMSHLFVYKMKSKKDNIYEKVFPQNALSKVFLDVKGKK